MAAGTGVVAPYPPAPYSPKDPGLRIDISHTETIRPDGAWSDISGRCSVYSCGPWLRHIEKRRDVPVRYLWAAVDGTVEAGLPTYLFTGQISNPFYDPEILFGEMATGPLRLRPFLLGGGREGYLGEVAISRKYPDPRSRQLLAGALLGELRQQARLRGALAGILYLTDETVELLAASLRPQDRLLVLDAEAVLDVPRGGCAEYLDGLSSKKRISVRREIRRLRDMGFSTQVESLGACYPELGSLSADFLDRHGRHGTAAEEVARYKRQFEDFGDLSRVFTARKDGELAGFVEFFEWNGVLYGRTLGFTGAAGRDGSLYFNLAYYSAIEYAAQNGLSEISYGCGSFEVKVRRGARLRPLWCLLLDAEHLDELIDFQAEEERRLAEYRRWDPSVVSPTVQRFVDLRGVRGDS
jgi:uncharacterized protein